MKDLLARILRRGLARVPQIGVLTKACRFYLNFYSGEDNPDFHTNGEGRVLREALAAAPDVHPGFLRVVFDVGANVGDWAAMALAINPSLELHCFEPAAESFARLRGRGLPANVVCNAFGLSDESGEATLHQFSEVGDTSSLHYRASATKDAPQATQTVRLQTMDDYCSERNIGHIDYVKIDTEGHELAVLKGMNRLLSAGAVDRVQVEYSAAYVDAGITFAHVFELLSEHNYRCFKIRPRGLMAQDHFTAFDETYRLSNWLFVRHEGLP